MKNIRPEQRQWTVNQKELVPTRKGDKYCKKCLILLSKYNLGNYCFTHNYLDTKEKDIKFEQAYRQQKLNQRKYK